MYIDPKDRCIYITFQIAEKFEQFLLENDEAKFTLQNGDEIDVKISAAGKATKYVRIFRLPHATKEDKITAILAQYGIVKSIVREKFNQNTGWPGVFSGVRGVTIELQKDIPQFINIGEHKA